MQGSADQPANTHCAYCGEPIEPGEEPGTKYCSSICRTLHDTSGVRQSPINDELKGKGNATLDNF